MSPTSPSRPLPPMHLDSSSSVYPASSPSSSSSSSSSSKVCGLTAFAFYTRCVLLTTVVVIVGIGALMLALWATHHAPFASSGDAAPAQPAVYASTGGGDGGGGAPFNPPWNTTADYCLGYGTNDSTLCLLALMSTPGYLRVPVPNFTYYVALHVTFYVQPLVVGPGTYFDGQNCTFVNIAPTPYIYSDQVGWIEDPLGYKGRNFEWFCFMMYVASNSVIYNVTLVSPIPAQALTILNSAYNVRLAYMTITNIPGLFVNTTDSLQFSIKRNGINIADYAHDIEIDHCYLYNVGYGIIIDASYVYNVDIHDNVIANVSADGVCINSPAFGYEIGQVVNSNPNATLIPYYYIPYTSTNISVHDNSISWTGWSHYGTVYVNSNDESFGFGISVAGGWNISMQRNYLYSTTWQAVHIEAHAHYLTVADNVMDRVGGTGWWYGYINGVWASQVYWLNITGNTFRNIAASAVRIEPSPSLWCIPETGAGYSLPCVPLPGQEWHLRWVWITGNTFQSWGLDLGCHEFAVYVGGAAVQEVQTFLSNNTYNPVYANLNGSCNQNGYVFCNCAYNVSVNELSPPLTGCTGNVFTDTYCELTNPLSRSDALLAWWSSLSVQQPQQYIAPTTFNAQLWDVTQFGVQTWVDSTGSSYAATTPSSAAALAPVFTATTPGQPGLFFTPNSLLQAPSLWPTRSNYTLTVVVWPNSTLNGPILSTATRSSLSILNGSLYLLHNGVAASRPASIPVSVANPVVVTVSYSHSSQQVLYYVNGYAAGSATLATDNTDGGLSMGGGYVGWLFDVELYGAVMPSADVSTLAVYLYESLYCRLFVYLTNNQCAQT